MAGLTKTEQNLEMISKGIASGTEARLIEAVTRVGLDGLADPELLKLARIRRMTPAVFFIATLRFENNFLPKEAALVMAAYRSLTSKSLDAEIDALGDRSPVRQLISVIINGDAEPLSKLRKSRIGPEWLLAIELAVDFHRNDLAFALVESFVQKSPSAVELLVLIQSMAARQKHLPAFVDMNCFVDCMVLLEKSYRPHATPELRNKIIYHIAEAYELAGKFEEALAFCKKLTGTKVSTSACFAAARISTRAAQIEAACGWFDRFVTGLLDRELAEGADLDAVSGGTPAPAGKKDQFPVEKAGAALRDLCDILEPLGLKPFLVSGTLLGYARHGGFLSHDKDIDVGLFGWDDQFKIFDALQRSGKFKLKFDSLRGKQAYTVPVIHTGHNIAIDIFLYHAVGDKVVTGVNFQWDFTATFEFSPFGLKPAEFCGTRIYVPDDIDTNMAENFGAGWRVPDPDYQSHLESPSVSIKGGPVHMLLTWDKLSGGLIDKKIAKVRRVVRFAEDYDDNPLAPSRALRERILDWCDRLERAKAQAAQVKVLENA